MKYALDMTYSVKLTTFRHDNRCQQYKYLHTTKIKLVERAYHHMLPRPLRGLFAASHVKHRKITNNHKHCIAMGGPTVTWARRVEAHLRLASMSRASPRTSRRGRLEIGGRPLPVTPARLVSYFCVFLATSNLC